MSVGVGRIHLSSLVLGDLVLGVLVALLALAVRLAGLGNVDLMAREKFVSFRSGFYLIEQ